MFSKTSVLSLWQLHHSDRFRSWIMVSIKQKWPGKNVFLIDEGFRQWKSRRKCPCHKMWDETNLWCLGAPFRWVCKIHWCYQSLCRSQKRWREVTRFVKQFDMRTGLVGWCLVLWWLFPQFWKNGMVHIFFSHFPCKLTGVCLKFQDCTLDYFARNCRWIILDEWMWFVKPDPPNYVTFLQIHHLNLYTGWKIPPWKFEDVFVVCWKRG